MCDTDVARASERWMGGVGDVAVGGDDGDTRAHWKHRYDDVSASPTKAIVITCLLPSFQK